VHPKVVKYNGKFPVAETAANIQIGGKNQGFLVGGLGYFLKLLDELPTGLVISCLGGGGPGEKTPLEPVVSEAKGAERTIGRVISPCCPVIYGRERC